MLAVSTEQDQVVWCKHLDAAIILSLINNIKVHFFVDFYTTSIIDYFRETSLQF